MAATEVKPFSEVLMVVFPGLTLGIVEKLSQTLMQKGFFSRKAAEMPSFESFRTSRLLCKGNDPLLVPRRHMK